MVNEHQATTNMLTDGSTELLTRTTGINNYMGNAICVVYCDLVICSCEDLNIYWGYF